MYQATDAPGQRAGLPVWCGCAGVWACGCGRMCVGAGFTEGKDAPGGRATGCLCVAGEGRDYFGGVCVYEYQEEHLEAYRVFWPDECVKNREAVCPVTEVV